MKNKKFYTQVLKILPVFTVDLFPYPRQQCCGEVWNARRQLLPEAGAQVG